MTQQENYLSRPDFPEMFGVIDNLLEARFSGDKEFREKIERGESKRYSPTLFNSSGKKQSKKREREVKLSWRNAEEANKKWEEFLKNKPSKQENKDEK